MPTQWMLRGQPGDTAEPIRWPVEDEPLVFRFPPADWRGLSTFSIRLDSARQAHTRVRIQPLGPGDRVLGQVTFAVDWAGENDMQFWLDRFEPRQPADRWADVHGLRLECAQAGLWPAELRVGAVAVTAQPARFDVNASDTIIEAGWHYLLCRPEDWHVVPDQSTVPAAEARVRAASPMWMINREAPTPEAAAELYREEPASWLSFEFPQNDTPRRLTLERRLGLEVGACRDILAKATWDQDILLTVTAIVDGGRQIVLTGNEPAHGSFFTVGAALDGAQRLDAVRVTLAEQPQRSYATRRTVGAGLFWVLLRRPTPLDEAPIRPVRVHTGPPDARAMVERQVPQALLQEPPDSTTPIGDPLTGALPIGFFLRRDELPALRETALRGPGKAIFDQILAEADAAIATDIADRNAYGNAYWAGIGHPKGFRGAGLRIFVPPVALAHLITGDPKYAMACRRWVLRAVRSDMWMGESAGMVDRPYIGECTHYDDSFTGWWPRGFGGYMDHPFFVAFIGEAVALAYDMLHHCFSPAEREEVEQGMARLGLYILYDKLNQSHDYYVKMNQGALYALPLMMQTAFLKPRHPVYQRLHDFAIQFLKDFGAGPWDEEGVCGEGPGYGLGTAQHFCEILPAMAACLGRPVADVIPPAFRKVMDYVQHVRSTWQPIGRPQFLGWSDGSDGAWVSGEVLAFFARYLNDPVARYFWDERYAAQPPGSMLALLWLPGSGSGQPPRLPPARVFRNQPLAFLRTGWQPGDTLVALTGIRQVLGHGHRDRGSLILEYGGEQLLLDPGMIAYSDPTASLYKQTACHNTLTFSQRSQPGGTAVFETAIRGFASSSGDTCPGRAGGIDWVIADLGAAYPEARSFLRHVIFLRPDVVLVYDEVEARQDEAMELNFVCLGPIAPDGGGFVSATAANRLAIHTQSDCRLQHDISGWGTHWPDIPSYRLVRATAAPARRARFLTVLAPSRREEPAPAITPLETGDGLGVRVRVRNEEALAFFHAAPADRRLPGDIRTDARGWVLRWSAGQLIGAAMLGGTRLDAAQHGGPAGPILSAPGPVAPDGLTAVCRD